MFTLDDAYEDARVLELFSQYRRAFVSREYRLGLGKDRPKYSFLILVRASYSSTRYSSRTIYTYEIFPLIKARS